VVFRFLPSIICLLSLPSLVAADLAHHGIFCQVFAFWERIAALLMGSMNCLWPGTPRPWSCYPFAGAVDVWSAMVDVYEVCVVFQAVAGEIQYLCSKTIQRKTVFHLFPNGLNRRYRREVGSFWQQRWRIPALNIQCLSIGQPWCMGFTLLETADFFTTGSEIWSRRCDFSTEISWRHSGEIKRTWGIVQ
jgi:hypothetical protein